MRVVAFLALMVALFAPSAHSVAVMSIDLGSEWMKVAVVTVRTEIHQGNVVLLYMPTMSCVFQLLEMERVNCAKVLY